ncbi:UNVERIFIED_CONTAM: hypothetical protein HDU68_006639, partial [Siphonaria sp. JEL0065]
MYYKTYQYFAPAVLTVGSEANWGLWKFCKIGFTGKEKWYNSSSNYSKDLELVEKANPFAKGQLTGNLMETVGKGTSTNRIQMICANYEDCTTMRHITEVRKASGLEDRANTIEKEDHPDEKTMKELPSSIQSRLQKGELCAIG